MALEGTLEDMPLRDLVSIFRETERSGVLTLQTRTEQADIFVFAGKLRDAIVTLCGDQRVLATGDAALRYLTRWQEATFVFRHDDRVACHPLRLSATSHQILRATYRVDADTCVRLVAALRGEASVLLSRMEWRVLCSIAERGQIHEISKRAGITHEYTCDIIETLLAKEVIEIVLLPRDRLRSGAVVAVRGQVPRTIPHPVLDSVIQFVQRL